MRNDLFTHSFKEKIGLFILSGFCQLCLGTEATMI